MPYTTLISCDEVAKHVKDPDWVLVDCRFSLADPQAGRQQYLKGHIPGAVHVPRGFLEFIADPDGPMHKPELSSGRKLMVYCGSGGRSILAAKTLHDMGITDLVNVGGGFQGWAGNGGAVES